MVQISDRKAARVDSKEQSDFLSRWQERSIERHWNTDKMSGGNVLNIDSPSRATARLLRLANDPVAQAFMKQVRVEEPQNPFSHEFQEFAAERLIGNNDIIDITFLKIGTEVSKSVCRLNYARESGFGTGFMVSPRLLMTNNHVLRDETDAANTKAEFNYENNTDKRLEQVVSVKLRPDQFFLTSKDLDFTIVAVDDPNRISEFGYNKLFPEEGKAVIGEHINIIQHPNGEPKKLCVSNNQLVDVLDNYIHYVTDTLPGSSGAPVYNNQWELIALHHTGVARRNANKEALLRDGTIWRKGIPDSQVDWVANEGIRVSRIIKEVQSRDLDRKAKSYISELLGVEGRMKEIVEAVEKPFPTLTDLSRTSEITEAAQVTVNIPITIQISFDGAGQPKVKTLSNNSDHETHGRNGKLQPKQRLIPIAEIVQQEKFVPDPDWSTRTGYDPLFLGKSLRVAIPALSSDQQTKAAVVDREYRSKNGDYVLDYSHYSVVMNGQRRLAFFSAGNIDGKNWFKIVRKEASGGSDKWFLDDRISEDEQVGEQLYAANDIDRGHIIRREYMTWGTREEALQANNDTFMFTNCSPQHKDLNQGKQQWLGLEDYVLTHAKNESQKVSVFAGPIFAKNDPSYRGLIQIPLAFWKVVVMATEDKKLSATGYILRQDSLIEDVIASERYVYGDFNNYQVPISYISQKTKLNFGSLINHDPLNSLDDEELYTDNAFIKGRKLSSTNDVQLF